MEKKIIKKPGWKSVPVEKEVEVFITRDGKEFQTEALAKSHEDHLEAVDLLNQKFPEMSLPISQYKHLPFEDFRIVKSESDLKEYIQLQQKIMRNFEVDNEIPSASDYPLLVWYDSTSDHRGDYFPVLAFFSLRDIETMIEVMK